MSTTIEQFVDLAFKLALKEAHTNIDNSARVINDMLPAASLVFPNMSDEALMSEIEDGCRRFLSTITTVADAQRLVLAYEMALINAVDEAVV